LDINDNVAFIRKRYGSSDPFKLADALNVEVDWSPLPESLLGRTVYYDDDSIILLNTSIRCTNKRIGVMAHELGHVVLHGGIATYFHTSNSESKMEYQADKFATALLTQLYFEENNRLPETHHDIELEYGVNFRE
jgi:Zn-dependent peptidase ImmA (M78 family)